MNKRLLAPFIDLLFCILLILLCIITLLKTNSEETPSIKQHAIYNILLTWDGADDLDLVGRDGKGRNVSFQRREGGQGSLFSLNHDALGTTINNTDEDGNVVSETNQEIVFLRGIVEGEYIFNVHSYSKRETTPTKAIIQLIKVKPYKEMAKKELIFNDNGEEKTAFRFTIDKTTEEIKDLNFLEAKIVYNQ